ncbi:MAG: T9SS type A sorting domain-containing protein [Chitinophagales bacterium]|nr:T9SS type A sorting domain-containing protein [Chitinophagales bacterium]
MKIIFLFSSFAAVFLVASMPVLFRANYNLSSELNNKKTFKENSMEAYEALTFLTARDAFPNNDIPADGYRKAWERHGQILAAMNKRASADQSPWQNIGPTNTGGRTISIAIDPADTFVIWLGSASGGLWKSSTGGIGENTWSYIPTGFPVLGVGGIAINPSNSQEMFIGTGEVYAYGTSTNGLVDRTQRGSYGIGILKTTDGGATWSTSLDWSFQQQRGAWEIIYNPQNPESLLAATTEGIYRTDDDGLTWSNVLDQKMVMDILWDPIDTSIAYAGVGNEESKGKGIYKSVDGGRTWVLLTNGLPAYTEDGRINLAFDPADHNILFAHIANRFNTLGMYKSIDNAESWSKLPYTDIASYQGWYAKGLLINKNDQSEILAAGVDIFKSENSGSLFINTTNFNSNGDISKFHADVHDVISNPLDPDQVYAITDGGLYRSGDFGSTFYPCVDGYVAGQFYIGSLSATDPDLALGGLQDNNTFIYTGLPAWTESNIGGDGSYNAIDQTDDYIQYGSAQYLFMAKSTDRGNIFDYLFIPDSQQGTVAFLAPFVLSPSDQETIYAGASTLYKTTDAGLTWLQTQPDPVDGGNAILSIAVSASNTDILYFGTAPSDFNPMHLFRSDDGGFTIHDISNGLPNRYPNRIAVNPLNDQELYVVFSGFGGGHIFKSENGGSSWTDISISLPDLPFHCLTIDPLQPKNLYAGCDFTVYASTDGGLSWFTYATNFPDAVMVFDLVISPGDRTLLAFTHGHGVYKNQLLDVSAGIAEINASSFTIFPNPVSDRLTISTNNKGGLPLSINIYNSLGALIKTQKLVTNSGGKISVDVSSLSEGNFLVSLVGNNLSLTRKMVVLR